MKLTTNYMTRNDCYVAGRKIKPSGIMVHSTATPGVMAASWFNRWNKSYKAGELNAQVCVHAFVDDTGVWEYLPWDHRGWHAGGSANNTHIGFEICEPPGFKYVNNAIAGYIVKAQETYFRKIWTNAVGLCVYLCKLYGLNEQNIICHSEGYAKGVASQHSDVMHWFPLHGKNMDIFRAEVKAALNEEDEIMTQDKFNALMTNWQNQNNPFYATLGDVPGYWREEAAMLVSAGVIKGDGSNSFGLSRETLKALILCKRYAEKVMK